MEAIACSERLQCTDFAFIARTLGEMEIEAVFLLSLKLKVPDAIAFIKKLDKKIYGDMWREWNIYK